MLDILYYNSLLAGWVILFTLGFILFFSKVPNTEVYRQYNRTRKLLGVALIFWGVQVLLQWSFNLRAESMQIASALNITCFYFAAVLFGMGYTSLLDANYINRRQIRSDFTKWGVVCTSAWLAVLFLHGTALRVALITCAIAFFLDAVRIAVAFFKTYYRTIRVIDNYYSDQTDLFIHWLLRSTYGIVIFGLSGAVMAFAPMWVVGLYMSAGIIMFVYIFVSLQNYLLNYETVQVAADVVPVQSEKSQPTSEIFKEQLNEWVARRGYRQVGLTIEQLATSLGSNRSYISDYFNKECGVSFRDWINDLCINDAKQLLLQNAELTIEQTAETVGFSSKAYFSTLFKQH